MSGESGKIKHSDMSLQEEHCPQGQSGTKKRSNSPVSSCVSLKSNQSMAEPLTLTGGSVPQESGPEKRTGSPVHSTLSQQSLKSNQSMAEPLTLKVKPTPQERIEKILPSLASSTWSLKTDQSKTDSIRRGSLCQTRDHKDSNSPVTGDKLQKKRTDYLFNIFDDLRKKIFVFVQHELEMYKKLLRKENTNYYEDMKEEMWDL
ncbi:uncharacterized protein [Hoplias malabaricus]|uniref:uncharacterized protein n=1 Tax=Hoplias malabaricus TaxID=27720 RepID=UPI0034626FAF